MTTPASKAFRAILKSAKVTFKDDLPLLVNSSAYTRQKFLENKDVADPKQLDRLLTAANATAHLLRRNVVQGVKGENDVFRLNIDQHKELNDNETVKINSQKYKEKMLNKKKNKNGESQPSVGCCGGNSQSKNTGCCST